MRDGCSDLVPGSMLIAVERERLYTVDVSCGDMDYETGDFRSRMGREK